jgi:hypothetical protein
MLRTMSEPLDSFALNLALRGWRDRSAGTMHLGPCHDFESLDAELIEDAVWRPEDQHDRLCPACFPQKDERTPPRRKRLEPYGY